MHLRKKKRKLMMRIGILMLCLAAMAAAAAAVIIFTNVLEPSNEKIIIQPDEVLRRYMAYISEGKYEEMYALLAGQSQSYITEEDFISKNKNVYEGIGAQNITIQITEITEEEGQTIIGYDSRMDTLAGEISFSSKAYFVLMNLTDDGGSQEQSLHAKNSKSMEEEYRLLWTPQLIFPNLGYDDRVKVNTLKSERGRILDRNGDLLAGKGMASSVGFVPGKMGEDRDADIEKAAELLDISVETINKKLGASYVKDDMFIPVRTIQKGQEELEALLLEIKGIMIADTEVRAYPLGEKASHLTGYIQNVSAEDLERLEGQEYNSNSLIGRAGLEKIYEDQLRGIDGYEIVILDKEGNTKRTLAKKHPRHGDTTKLTVDAGLQSFLYDQFCNDKSTVVAMNPKTGEILALVSSPSFDANDFVLGLSTNKWDALNEDENMPLYNRFKAILCPGSGFKPIIGAIGLTVGKIRPDDNYGYSGFSWQKDASWGRYEVTTLKEYGDQAVLRNALVYSDNIYFAKAALNIGEDILAEQLLNIGFDEELPFEIGLYWSSFSNTNTFESEIQLADSGYGQAQILINPIHMASMYSAFINDGSMIKPYLLFDGSKEPEFWKERAFTKEAADIIREDLIQVVEQGAGGLAKIEGVTLAGKTGTAEIKQTKDDKEGTELGWFNVFTADETVESPLLIIAMVEDVKDRGGSGYVIPKVKTVFENR